MKKVSVGVQSFPFFLPLRSHEQRGVSPRSEREGIGKAFLPSLLPLTSYASFIVRSYEQEEEELGLPSPPPLLPPFV